MSETTHAVSPHKEPLDIPDDLKEYLSVPECTEEFYSEYTFAPSSEYDLPSEETYKKAYYPRYYLAVKKNTKEEAAEALFSDIRKLKDQGVKLAACHCPPSILKIRPDPNGADVLIALFFPHLDLMPDLADRYAESIKKLQESLGSATYEGNIAGQ